LQGLDPDGCEFVIAFDNGNSSEFNTLLITDWHVSAARPIEDDPLDSRVKSRIEARAHDRPSTAST
jgi:hypothetical protein